MLYNIIITLEGLDISFQLELREMLKKYKTNYNLNGNIQIEADKVLIEQLEQWDIKIERII